jgi:hypothetical protein
MLFEPNGFFALFAAVSRGHLTKRKIKYAKLQNWRGIHLAKSRAQVEAVLNGSIMLGIQ